MSLAQRLYTLQTTDITLAARRKRLTEAESALGESEELRQARAGAQDAEATAHKRQIRQRDLEIEAQGLADRIQQNERRLYSGTVRNPKELQSMQDDLAQWQRMRSSLEDQLLDTMMVLEDAQTELGKRQEELAVIESDWQADQAGLTTERGELLQEMKQLEGQRQQLAAGLTRVNLALYERLRGRLGRAVAQEKSGACEVCGVTLPTGLVRRIGSGDELSRCPNCERILS